MPKRKFTEPTNASLSNEEELQRTLSQGQTQLFRALKLARGFERQKLGRRQKDATKTGNGTEQQARLQAEVDAVKVCLYTMRAVLFEYLITLVGPGHTCSVRVLPAPNAGADDLYCSRARFSRLAQGMGEAAESFPGHCDG